MKILQYLYEKYHVACNNEGLLNACLCADLPSSKYIIETMNVIPNSTHIERLCENCLDIEPLKYLHNDLNVTITKKAIDSIKENEKPSFIKYIKKLQLIGESSSDESN
ncbi:hypothetical protein BMW23_0948 [Bodo saltans virus]|uniref:Uncharacterized protein n=1 Tax=Bodo saltans virus TaxID=2024608 RepID=A0A2H4UVQ1_9VIRU|nr:hypothetical protein QJ851_gp0930 [Bodo saltans virus]ATZ80993.1 hypothetical protein BMW23_0948 [Bodo saltans virus]